MKDNFSANASAYAQFRPDYPGSVVQFLLSQSKRREAAWDCGTGNGQLAVKLAPHFTAVFATDISEAQLMNAPLYDNIIYKKERAEFTEFADRQFDLVTVAQAIHWFDFDAFYREVYRTLNDDGLFAVAGYYVPRINPEVDAVVDHLYEDITGPYWDAERRYVDELYATIPFPFDEMPVPRLTQQYRWTLAQLRGYLLTWSGVQHYIKAAGSNPVDLIGDDLKMHGAITSFMK